MTSNVEAETGEPVGEEEVERALENIFDDVRDLTNLELRYGRLEGSRSARGLLYRADSEDIYVEAAALEDMSVESLSSEVSGLEMDDVNLWVLPEGFAALLSEVTGQYDIGLYDRPDEKEGEWPELPEKARKGIAEVATGLAELSVGSVRVSVNTYERDGAPQFLRYTEGEVSDHVMREFLEAFGATGLPSEYVQNGSYHELAWSRYSK